jgi:hypothetical protein
VSGCFSPRLAFSRLAARLVRRRAPGRAVLYFEADAPSEEDSDETEKVMRLGVFLALLLTCAALSGASLARAQTAAQAAPPDRVTLEEFTRLRAAGKVFVLDVRYQIDAKIKGSTHIPLDQLEARLSELPHDREIITYCS